MPSATSSAIAPVGITSSAARVSSPSRMTEPLPNCRSMLASAVSSAFSRSAAMVIRLSVRLPVRPPLGCGAEPAVFFTTGTLERPSDSSRDRSSGLWTVPSEGSGERVATTLARTGVRSGLLARSTRRRGASTPPDRVRWCRARAARQPSRSSPTRLSRPTIVTWSGSPVPFASGSPTVEPAVTTLSSSTIAQSTLAPRSMTQFENTTLLRTTAPASTTTPGPRTLRRTSPCTRAPGETRLSTTTPPSCTRAGTRCGCLVRIGHDRSSKSPWSSSSTSWWAAR